MADGRATASKYPEVMKAVADNMQQPKTLISALFAQLTLKDFIDQDDTAVDNILSRVFVRRDLWCPQPVEIPYYSSGMF
ncbi:hypothetical protein LSAT2_027573, partial [Lamellibrachia satsuma]